MSFLSSIKSNPNFNSFALLVVRLFVGVAMLTHGYPKLTKLMAGGDIEFFDFLGIGSWLSLVLAVFAEIICSILLILGLCSRLASFFLFFTMLVAGFLAHADDSFKKMELSLLYASVYLLILAIGPGKFSIDALINRKKSYF